MSSINCQHKECTNQIERSKNNEGCTVFSDSSRETGFKVIAAQQKFPMYLSTYIYNASYVLKVRFQWPKCVMQNCGSLDEVLVEFSEILILRMWQPYTLKQNLQRHLPSCSAVRLYSASLLTSLDLNFSRSHAVLEVILNTILDLLSCLFTDHRRHLSFPPHLSLSCYIGCSFPLHTTLRSSTLSPSFFHHHAKAEQRSLAHTVKTLSL